MSAVLADDKPRRESWLYRVLHTPVYDLLCARVRPRLSVDGIIAAADLPDAVAQRVRNVVRRSRLTRAERADVATELVEHFRDGLEFGAMPAELLERFGDEHQAARLIRRAKKRARPAVLRWLEHFGHAVLVVIALIIIVYAVQAVRLYGGAPEIKRNFLAEWNASARAVPPADRAWPLYVDAYVAYAEWPVRHRADLTPEGERWPEVAAFVRAHPEVVAGYRAAAQRPRLGVVLEAEDQTAYKLKQKTDPVGAELMGQRPREENPLLMNISLAPITVLRHASRWLLVDAWLAVEAGDAERFMQDVRGQLAILRHARELRFVVSDLVAVAVQVQTGNLVDRVLAEHSDFLGDAHLAELAHRFGATAGRLDVRYDGERAVFHDVLQRYYNGAGLGAGLPRPRLLELCSISDGLLVAGPQFPLPEVLMPVLTPFMAGRGEIERQYAEIFAQCQAEACRPLWERTASRAEQMIAELKADPLDRWRYLPIAVLMPSLTRASIISEYATQHRDATLVALALSAYHRRHGEWPAQLEQLVPDLLPAVPPDRYDGQPLKYRVVDGRPLVYSIGVDRDDDGGRLPDPEQLPPGSPREPRQAAREWITPGYAQAEPERVPDGDWLLWPPE